LNLGEGRAAAGGAAFAVGLPTFQLGVRRVLFCSTRLAWHTLWPLAAALAAGGAALALA
jgi:hypothetical protein